MAQSFSIAGRFNGPPDVGNGGYVAGMIACSVAQPVTVRLHKPVPLETPLRVVTAGEHWDVVRGDAERIASARVRTSEQAPVPAPPPFDEAERSAREALVTGSLRFSGCFVCGPARPVGDGLRIFSGRIDDGVVAAPWVPAADLADATGRVAPEFVWAALDCPGYFATFQDGRYALLGELAVEQLEPVEAGAPHVVLGWRIAQQGRKRTAGTALFDAAGRCLARGVAAWIQVDDPA